MCNKTLLFFFKLKALVERIALMY